MKYRMCWKRGVERGISGKIHRGYIMVGVECRTMELEFHSVSKGTPSRVFQAQARQDLGCVLERQLEDCET